jgi:hypothetical protein
MWTVSMIGERRLAFVVLNETSTTTIMYHITTTITTIINTLDLTRKRQPQQPQPQTPSPG